MPDYLQQRRRRWYAVLEIPRPLRPQFAGKPRFVRSLGTDSHAEARRKVGRIISDWMDELHRARTGQGGPRVAPNNGRDDKDPALWRRLLRDAETQADRDFILEMIGDRADDIALATMDWDQSPSEVSKAAAFFNAAVAIETTAYVDDWLATTRTAPKTKDMARSDVSRFAAAFPTLGKVEGLAVRSWVNGLMQGEGGLSPKTVQRALGAIRGYWRYLEDEGRVERGRAPFDRLDVARQARREGTREKRRPFDPGHVVRLCTAARAGGDGALADLITLAMWTGCRIEELCSLKVADIDLTAGSLTIREGKTDAAARVVPIHSRLRPLVVALVGQRQDGWLLAELTPNKYGDRSNAVGKRFGRLRTAAGFGPEVVFHSIRKTVATMLEQAGVSENLAADILGHEKPRITYGLYSGGASLAGKREAIEKLVYPSPPD